MKKIIIALVCALISASGAFAQDARQRTTQTIVVDALAQLPVATKADYNTVMNELMGTGAQGVEQLAGMLVPAADGKNNIVEYALDGMITYASGYANDAQRAQLAEGLKNAIDKCTDNPNKAFLMTLLQKISRKADAPFFVKYLNDEYLTEWAQNGLILTPDCDEEVLAVAGSVSPAVFARLVGAKKIAAAEPALVAMLPAGDAAVYKALANMGTVASIPVLAKAAKAENYAWVPGTDATASYTKLLTRLAEDPVSKKAVAKAAKELLKKTNNSNVRCGALYAIVLAEGNAAQPYIVKAMYDNDRKYRVAALRYYESALNPETDKALLKILADKKDVPAKVDITNWFGTNCYEPAIDVIAANFNSANDDLATASIFAASKIGGDKALVALIDALNGSRGDVAKAALLSFNGSINDAVVVAIADNSNPAKQVKALQLAGARRIKAAAPGVFALLNSSNADVAAAANAALGGVASVNDFGKLCNMLETAPADKQPQLQSALMAAVAPLSADDQYNTVKPYVAKSKNPALYYPVLAQAGNSAAIAELKAGYANPATKQAALNALLQVNNPEMIEVLYNIATTEADANAAALNRYAALVANAPVSNVRKYQLYRSGLEASKNAQTSNQMLAGLASTGMYQALMIANKNIANADLADAAATAIRTIMNKNTDNYGGTQVTDALNNAANVFLAEKEKGNADAGYAVDDIKGMLAKVGKDGYTKLAGDNLKYVAVVGAPGAKIAPKAKKAAEKAAATAWEKTCCGIKYLGGEQSTIALEPKGLENFEMWFDWKSDAAPVVGVRSMPVNIEGAFTNALNPAGEWNTAYVKVVNDRATVVVNGVTTAQNAILVNPYNNELPAYSTGEILLSGNGTPIAFRDIYVKQLPSTPRSQLTPEEVAEGFEMLFDGSSMHKWTGNTAGYIPNDGYMYVNSQWGGNLYTIKEYSDFIYRFEFCFDRPGVNNGVGIRTPMGVDAAFHGMEIQILDHDDPIYKDLNDYQVHGSVYGVIPAKRAKFEHGVWNTEEIRAVGDHITVIVNGEVILDGNIREACQGHAVGDEGEEGNHWMIDHRNHPGLFNKSGHIGFLGHGEGIRFRNVRVKDLSSKKK